MAECMCEWEDGCGGTGIISCIGCGGDICVCRECFGAGTIDCTGCDDCDYPGCDDHDYEDMEESTDGQG